MTVGNAAAGAAGTASSAAAPRPDGGSRGVRIRPPPSGRSISPVAGSFENGHRAYLEAVEGAFGSDVDYAQLVKLYGPSWELTKGRYSPAECIGARKERIEGNPDPDHISTSYAERSNLSVRMHTRRFTRLTNGFSKKVENHAHSVALFATYYNFVWVHKTLRNDSCHGRWRD